MFVGVFRSTLPKGLIRWTKYSFRNMRKALHLHFEGMAEDGEPIPLPGGAGSYDEVMKDLNVDQYFLGHVRIAMTRFAAGVTS